MLQVTKIFYNLPLFNIFFCLAQKLAKVKVAKKRKADNSTLTPVAAPFLRPRRQKAVCSKELFTKYNIKECTVTLENLNDSEIREISRKSRLTAKASMLRKKVIEI